MKKDTQKKITIRLSTHCRYQYSMRSRPWGVGVAIRTGFKHWVCWPLLIIAFTPKNIRASINAHMHMHVTAPESRINWTCMQSCEIAQVPNRPLDQIPSENTMAYMSMVAMVHIYPCSYNTSSNARTGIKSRACTLTEVKKCDILISTPMLGQDQCRLFTDMGQAIDTASAEGNGYPLRFDMRDHAWPFLQ